MAGPFIEQINQGVNTDLTKEFEGEELDHQDLRIILNNHSKTGASSSPAAMMASGLPYYYKISEDETKHIAGVKNMVEFILDHEGPNGEIGDLIRERLNGNLKGKEEK